MYRPLQAEVTQSPFLTIPQLAPTSLSRAESATHPCSHADTGNRNRTNQRNLMGTPSAHPFESRAAPNACCLSPQTSTKNATKEVGTHEGMRGVHCVQTTRGGHVPKKNTSVDPHVATPFVTLGPENTYFRQNTLFTGQNRVSGQPGTHWGTVVLCIP